MYHKTDSNDSDIIGQVVSGPNSNRYKYKVKIDPNLLQILKSLRREVKQQIYQEMIKLNDLSPINDYHSVELNNQKQIDNKLMTIKQSGESQKGGAPEEQKS